MASLFQKVSEQSGDKSKRPLGYTVDSYKGVLSALDAARAVAQTESSTNQVNAQQPGYYIVTKRYSVMLDLKSGLIGEDSKGFFFDGEKPLYQGSCIFKDYMGFVVDCKKDNVAKTVYVSSNCNNLSLNCGESVLGAALFPTSPITKDSLKSSGDKLGGMKNTFKIGVGISIDNFALNFFKTYFGCYDWTQANIEYIAANGCLYAEIYLPYSESSSHVFHAKVTAKKEPITNEFNTVLIPIPLLLLSGYEKAGSVYVKLNDEEHVVGDGTVTNPLKNSLYYHKEAKIEEFTPKYIMDYALPNSSELKVPLMRTTLHDGTKGTVGRVRLYIDKESKSYIERNVKKKEGVKEIPKEYERELYQGKYSEDDIVETKEIVVQTGIFDDGDVDDFWLRVCNDLDNRLTLQQVKQAVALVANWESGGNWWMWEICGSGNGDGEGVSMGKFQGTQRAGAIKEYKKKFLELNGYMSDEMQNAIDSSKTGNQGGKYVKLSQADAAGLLMFKNEFKQQANTREGKLAQCYVWYDTKAKDTIKIFKDLNCSTIAEFSAIFGAINHLPIADKRYNRYKNEILGESNLFDKIVMIENVHWITVAEYSGRTPPQLRGVIDRKTIVALSPNNFGPGWANRYEDCIEKYKKMIGYTDS